MSTGYQKDSKSENFAAFCKVMTDAAENQLDSHRQRYYPICKEAYSRIMDCYANPRQTNEEADACANAHRQSMKKLESKLKSRVMYHSDWLETCTDKCVDERDMPCINKCGSTFLTDIHQSFDSEMAQFARQEKLNL